jgi:glycine cleavage system H protein
MLSFQHLAHGRSSGSLERPVSGSFSALAANLLWNSPITPGHNGRFTIWGDFMSELRFTEDHEWLRGETDGSVTVGITAFAQDALGDVVFVQLPELQSYDKGAEAATVESVKAASGVYMPLDGEIVETNPALDASPELVNEDPLGQGWFFRFIPSNPDAVGQLLTQDAYDRLIKANAEA